MSAAESEAAVDRLGRVAARYDDGDERAAYFFLVLGILGWQAPEVLGFVLDRADEQLGRSRS